MRVIRILGTLEPGGAQLSALQLSAALRRGRAVRVQVARDERAQGRVAVRGAQAGQPAVRAGVGHLAAWPGPKHSTPRCAAVLVSRRQRGHLSPNAFIVRSAAHGAGTIRDRLSRLVDGQPGASAAPMAAMTSSACSGVKRTPSGCMGTEDGRAGSAPVHIGRPAVGSGWMVPRGPGFPTASPGHRRWLPAVVRR
jgi:hypothetical protein